MKYWIIILGFITLLAGHKLNAQPVEKNSLEHLSLSTHMAAQKNDVLTKNRKSEYLLLFFEIDSLGKVKSIHIMNDSRNIDSTYSAFSKVKAEDLGDWINSQYKNKTIILPIISSRFIYRETDRTYVEKNGWYDFTKKIITDKNSDYIVADVFRYYWQGARIPEDGTSSGGISLPQKATKISPNSN